MLFLEKKSEKEFLLNYRIGRRRDLRKGGGKRGEGKLSLPPSRSKSVKVYFFLLSSSFSLLYFCSPTAYERARRESDTNRKSSMEAKED